MLTNTEPATEPWCPPDSDGVRYEAERPYRL
jgi:hypothetical protein